MNLIDVIEKENVITIFFNNKTLVRVYKNAVVEGSWEQCKELLEKYN